jgi:hypothetical protein
VVVGLDLHGRLVLERAEVVDVLVAVRRHLLLEELGDGARGVGLERVVKETLTKEGKDALNRKIGTLVFEKVYGSVPPLYQQVVAYAHSGGNPDVELIKQLRRRRTGGRSSCSTWRD